MILKFYLQFAVLSGNFCSQLQPCSTFRSATRIALLWLLSLAFIYLQNDHVIAQNQCYSLQQSILLHPLRDDRTFFEYTNGIIPTTL